MQLFIKEIIQCTDKESLERRSKLRRLEGTKGNLRVGEKVTIKNKKLSVEGNS